MMKISEFAELIQENVAKVIIGKRDAVELLLVALLCEGHVLLEDVPGVGKTTLAKALALSIEASFSRIQFTPDLLPGDVTGSSLFNQKSQEFEFRPGPIFAQIVLTDEINRATPKTQSALLEAMEERQVTVEGTTHLLPPPFMVIATQNPIEYEGTFPLPEAQLDRFMLRIRIGYPGRTEELAVLEGQKKQHPIHTLQQVTTLEELMQAQEAIKDVHVNDEVRGYMVDLVRATRNNNDVYLGSSSRGALALFRLCQAWAAMSDRDYVTPDDVKKLAVPALAHRIIVGPAARIRDISPDDVIDRVLRNVAVPV